MSWREFAAEVERGRNDRHIRHDRADMTANVPNVPIVLGVVPLSPPLALQCWRSELLKLDPREPQHGFSLARWRQLVDDAIWLLENYGDQAARLGWAAADLFGLRPGHDGLGGIADRLLSSRSLVMDADRAVWCKFGIRMTFNRGSYPELRLMWEFSR